MSSKKCDVSSDPEDFPDSVEALVDKYERNLDASKRNYERKVLDEQINLLKCINELPLPSFVNSAMDDAIKKMKDYMRARGKTEKEIENERWDHFTFATHNWQVKIDKEEDGKWHAMSETLYWREESIARFSEKDIEEREKEVESDIEVFKEIIISAKDGKMYGHLED